MKNINKLIAPKGQHFHAIASGYEDMSHSGLEIILESLEDTRLVWMQQVRGVVGWMGFLLAAAVSGVVGVARRG